MKLIELNNTLSSLFGETIILYQLIDQTAKKWYDKSYTDKTRYNKDIEFETSLIYGVSINGLIEFDFSVKTIDNLFKSFITNIVNKHYCKQTDWELSRCLTKSEVLEKLKIKFDNSRYSKGILYSTNYGVGMWYMLIPKSWIDKNMALIENKLNELQIKFDNEFSDAGWVYRYCFSGNYIDHNKIIELL